jgi:hypothetical protein
LLLQVLAFAYTVNEDYTEPRFIFPDRFINPQVPCIEGDIVRECMLAAITDYHAKRGTMPKKIVVYRKGESEGQVQNIREEEVEACWDAFDGQQGGRWQPDEFAYVMHNKHSGFKFTTKKKSNPPLGTVVQGKLFSSKYQFSLQSHQTTLAPVRAPLYTIINGAQMFEKDDAGEVTTFTSVEELIKLSFKLSGLFVNWAGMHPVPAVAKYALDAAKKVSDVGFSPQDYADFVQNVERANRHYGPRAPPIWFL